MPSSPSLSVESANPGDSSSSSWSVSLTTVEVLDLVVELTAVEEPGPEQEGAIPVEADVVKESEVPTEADIVEEPEIPVEAEVVEEICVDVAFFSAFAGHPH